MKLQTLTTHLLIRISAIVILLLAGCAALYLYQTGRVQAGIEQDEYLHLKETLAQRIEKKFDVGMTNALSMAASSGIQQSLSNGERDTALAELAKIGQVFKSQSNFKNIRVQLFTKDGKTFLRNWKPEAQGDLSESAGELIRASESRGQARAGWVADKDGVLIRGTAPVRAGDDTVGHLHFIQGVASVSLDYEAEGRFYVLLVNDRALQTAPQLGKNRSLGDMRLANDSWFTSKTVEALKGVDPKALLATPYLRAGGIFAIGVPLEDALGNVIGLQVLAEPESIVDHKVAAATITGKSLIVAMAAGFVLLSLIILAGLRITVLNPLAGLATYSGEVAAGDWSAQPRGSFRYELATLKNSMLAMVDNLKALHSDVAEKEREALRKAQEAERALVLARENEARVSTLAEAMRNAAGNSERISHEVLGALGDLVSEVKRVDGGMQSQRDRLSETATAMAQMNQTVLEVAQNASDAASNAATSRDKARTGAKGVNNAVRSIEDIEKRVLSLRDTMSSLGERTDSIGKILGVINDIADQTNLLALNAAIEAARAGDAGRGFAVVADEVRKLAEKTMQATQEVEAAIHSIQTVAKENITSVALAAQDIVTSTQAANEAGHYMEEIVSIVQDTSGKVESIAAASEEQSATSDQINRAVSEVTEVAGETSEGMARAGQTLKRVDGLIRELDSIIRGMTTS
jgi:methyl-accepting chemotaxis protein